LAFCEAVVRSADWRLPHHAAGRLSGGSRAVAGHRPAPRRRGYCETVRIRGRVNCPSAR
jgi:hypothetical protein